MHTPTIRRRCSDAAEQVTVVDGSTTVHAAFQPAAGQAPQTMFERQARFLAEQHLTVVHQFVFAGNELANPGPAAMAAALGPVEWPVTWLQAHSPRGERRTGTHILAVGSDTPVQRIRWRDRIVGSIAEDHNARHCFLGDLGPAAPAASRADQVRETLEAIEPLLEQADMAFHHVYRTWFYLDHILDWYDEFNRVRTAFFERLGVFERLVPASTGIGTANHRGHAVTCALQAIAPKAGHTTIRTIPSPMQCPAYDYKSAFSRAVEIDTPTQRQITVSGTASIAPEGTTIHCDDTRRQIDLTMRVVHAIFASRGLDWKHVTRAFGYFKHAADTPLYGEWLAEHGIPRFPTVLSHADVCRDDLLFEIECDAVAAR